MRPTRTVQLGNNTVVLYEYATGADAKAVYQYADKPEASDEILKRVVVSINGQSENVSKLAEDMKLEDYLALIKEATALFTVDVEKKSESSLNAPTSPQA